MTIFLGEYMRGFFYTLYTAQQRKIMENGRIHLNMLTLSPLTAAYVDMYFRHSSALKTTVPDIIIMPTSFNFFFEKNHNISNIKEITAT